MPSVALVARTTTGVTEAQEWLLKAAVLDGPEAVEAWNRWRLAVEFDSIDRNSTRLLPLAWHNLRAFGVTDPLFPRLLGVYRQAWLANQVRFGELSAAQAALRAAGIASLCLKGVALAHGYYPNPGMRPMEDVDLLVRPKDAPAAGEVLLRNGWTPLFDRMERVLLVRHAITFRNARGRELDLHAHVIRGTLRSDLDGERWERAVTIDDGAQGFRALDDTDQLLHVLVHGAESQPPTIHWMVDAMMILKRGPEVIDWTRLLHDAEREGRGITIGAALAQLEQLFDAPVPGWVRRVRSEAQRPIWERVEHRVAAGPPLFLVGLMLRRYVRYRRWRRAPWRTPRPPFTRYLQLWWDLDRRSQLPAEAVRRGLRRLARDPRQSRRASHQPLAR